MADGGAHAGDRSPDAEETDVIRPSTRSQRETEARSGAGCCLRPPGESGRKGAAEGSCAPAVGRLLGTPAPCPPCTLEEALEGGRKWGGCRARPAPLPGPARPSPSTPSPCPRLAELCQMLWGGEAGLEGSPSHPGATGGRELGALALGAGGVLGGLLSKHVEGLLCALPGAQTRPCRDETPALVECVCRGGGRGYHKQEYNAWPCPWRPASPAPSSRRIRRRQGHMAGEWWSHGWSVLDLETQLELGWGLP